jgi:hypothetical protein
MCLFIAFSDVDVFGLKMPNFDNLLMLFRFVNANILIIEVAIVFHYSGLTKNILNSDRLK